MNIEEIVEYIKHHIPIIIKYENGGWSNANIELKDGMIIIKPDYNMPFDD